MTIKKQYVGGKLKNCHWRFNETLETAKGRLRLLIQRHINPKIAHLSAQQLDQLSHDFYGTVVG